MNAIDLFAGCGGLSKGFIDAGFDVLLGIDNDQAALTTFEKNHNGAVALNADLSKPETFDTIRQLTGNKEIDVIIAGPPCQGFSLTGPRNFDDKRNKLYLAVFEMVSQFNPKAFVIENVPGMATLYDGQIKDEILRRFRKLGYDVDCNILCAADYGVPQIRRRLIFIGIRKDVGKTSFPMPIVSPDKYVTCRDAISDLPPLVNELGEEISNYTNLPQTDYQKKMRKNATLLYNHVATNHTQMVKDTIALVPEGGNYKDLPAGVGESRKFNEAWTRYDGNKPSRTIDTGHRNHFHYQYNRVPTVRENARLQSFPDDFVFYGTKTQQNRQVGNAVPPLLGYAIAKHILSIIDNTSDNEHKKVNTIDLFAGCGGLTDGFEATGHYNMMAGIEWDKAPCDNLRHRLRTKWRYSNADDIVMRFDIQRTDELIHGWTDAVYGTSPGLDFYINHRKVDLIIGGPPCQAYSVAGRIRDEHGMKNDYRNYLFESYLEIVKEYKPRAFVFENVPGMLTARPGNGEAYVVDLIRKAFTDAGYVLLDDLKKAIVDFTEYGVPQNRKRVVILGLRKEVYGNKANDMLNCFYFQMLPTHKVSKKRTVRDAIGDLPKILPLDFPDNKHSHYVAEPSSVSNHTPRFSNKRDMEVFKKLTEDIESGRNEYVSTDALKQLYTDVTGKTANVHKYYVLRWDEPSNTIPAHLHKDGLRHIHPDSRQLRTITVREAARLQTFPDDYEFISGMSDNYKMIGNAVPPMMAKIIAEEVYQLLFKK